MDIELITNHSSKAKGVSKSLTIKVGEQTMKLPIELAKQLPREISVALNLQPDEPTLKDALMHLKNRVRCRICMSEKQAVLDLINEYWNEIY